jgi:hypothetical protein
MGRVGPLVLSRLGTFTALDAGEYEDRLSSVMKRMVESEPAPKKVRTKRSKLLTQLKADLRQERVLAKKDETLDSHRVVSGYEFDEGLVADLVLKNGALHVIETVDASSEDEQARRAISDIAVAAIVMERARMKFGEKETLARLVYQASASLEKATRPALDAASHQGAELINWSSVSDRQKFIHSIASLANPLVKGRGKNSKRFVAGHASLKF